MRLASKIGNHFGMGSLGEKVVGIEIEMEANSSFPPSEKTKYHWSKEHDGSLRGEYNVEYVLRVPLKRENAFRALEKLRLALKERGTDVIDSVRAGTHIHINVRDLTFRELWSMVTCWYVLEELLTYTMCGKGRIGNHFCLGAQDADAVMFKINNVLKGYALNQLAKDDIRYAALNFVALFKYGSLEFRAMRTPQNFEEIKKWVDILIALKENSKLFPTPRHVVENFSYGGERNFLRAILGNEGAEMVIARDPDGWEKKLKRGVKTAQEIAYAKDDWEKDEEEQEKITPDLKKHYENIVRFAEQFDIRIENE